MAAFAASIVTVTTLYAQSPSADETGAAQPVPHAPVAPGGGGGGPLPPAPEAPVAASVQTAPAGKVLAHGKGLLVDEVAVSERAKPVRRLTVSGSFQVGALDYLVLLDGKPLGRGLLAENLDAAKVALPADVQLTQGATVSYQYGHEAPVTVGTLTLGGPR
ncbi:hypothetical protein GCM10010452_83180 [Crossiella cryophila]